MNHLLRFLRLNHAPAESNGPGGNQPITAAAHNATLTGSSASVAPANPTTAAVVMAGTKTEDQIRVEGELQTTKAELETVRSKLTTTETERKDRELTICELQDKLHALQKEKRTLEDVIGAKRKFKMPSLLIGE